MEKIPNKRIFIIEDSIDMSSLLSELFENEGYQVDTANNGQEALNKLQATTELPAVIFLDLMMPVMDGFKFREEQRKQPKIANIPVVVMTADGHIQSKAAQIEADDSLRKPMSVDSILKTARRFLVIDGFERRGNPDDRLRL